MCRFIDILLEKRPNQHVFNVGNKDTISIREWVQLCYNIVGKQAEFVNVHEDIEQRNYFSLKDYDEAEKLVDKFIIDKSECVEENDIMFTAASKLYEVMGKKQEKKKVEKAIKKYDECLEKYFLNTDFDEDDDLPFD